MILSEFTAIDSEPDLKETNCGNRFFHVSGKNCMSGFKVIKHPFSSFFMNEWFLVCF